MRWPVRHQYLNNSAGAFTLVELLVVLIIIALLAALGIPAIKGLTQSNTTASAQRQMLDDLAHARQLAIANRSDVYVVFVPPQLYDPNNPNHLTDTDIRNLGSRGGLLFTNLVAGQYRSYALLADRQVGDQPGVHTPRYLTDWRTLPEGVFFDPTNFWTNEKLVGFEGVKYWGFTNYFLPFPLATNVALSLPAIVFDSSGRLKTPDSTDVEFRLVRGGIFYPRDAHGNLVPGVPDVVQNFRQGTSVAFTNAIHVDWLTGRARVEQQEIQNP